MPGTSVGTSVIPVPKTGPLTLGPDSQRQRSVPRGTLFKHTGAIWPDCLT